MTSGPAVAGDVENPPPIPDSCHSEILRADTQTAKVAVVWRGADSVDPFNLVLSPDNRQLAIDTYGCDPSANAVLIMTGDRSTHVGYFRGTTPTQIGHYMQPKVFLTTVAW
jgi:hypothetical protein